MIAEERVDTIIEDYGNHCNFHLVSFFLFLFLFFLDSGIDEMLLDTAEMIIPIAVDCVDERVSRVVEGGGEEEVAADEPSVPATRASSTVSGQPIPNDPKFPLEQPSVPPAIVGCKW